MFPTHPRNYTRFYRGLTALEVRVLSLSSSWHLQWTSGYFILNSYAATVRKVWKADEADCAVHPFRRTPKAKYRKRKDRY
ncbi:hypothetical protein RUM43_012199 [Polyplax serrata]|uniref:Uncharacterized protein n=1 Tax=Polyplax serrata TaxID=468196 RepID=A0AAN8PD30_POLSC